MRTQSLLLAVVVALGVGIVLADETPLLRIGLLTDTHVTKDPASCLRFEQAMETFRREKTDVICHLGDFGEIHSVPGYQECRRIIEKTWPDEKARPVFLSAFGVHDAFNCVLPPDAPKDAENKPFAMMQRYLGFSAGLYETVDVRGVPFVSIPENFDMKRADAALASAAAKFPEKPIFVLLHTPGAETVPDAEQWGSWPARELLAKYPNAVHLSGHSHWTILDERCLWQGTHTEINAGCLTKWGEPSHLMEGVMVAELSSRALVVRRFDVVAKEEYRCCEPWTIPLPFDAKAAPYRIEARRARAKRPVFAEGTALKAAFFDHRHLRWDNFGYRVSFPECADAARYRLELKRTDRAGTPPFVQEIEGYYWLREGERPKEHNLTLSYGHFEPNATYRLSVTPLDFFAQGGEPLVAELRPTAAETRETVWTTDNATTATVVRAEGKIFFPEVALPADDPAGTVYRFEFDLHTVHHDPGGRWYFSLLDAKTGGGLHGIRKQTLAGDSGVVRYLIEWKRQKGETIAPCLSFAWGNRGGKIRVGKATLYRVVK